MQIQVTRGGVEIHRRDRILLFRFIRPQRLLSTCPVHGGIREDLEWVFNYQSCEPHGHRPPLRESDCAGTDPYFEAACRTFGLPRERSAMLGTAANMRQAGFSVYRYLDLEVAAVVTGGVETNAVRAGDPAHWMETEQGFRRVDGLGVESVPRGTINTVILVNREMAPGALVRAVITAGEAKAALLQELNVNSRYSDGLATGTGTDQIAVASPLGALPVLHDAGTHTKLGQLVALAVKHATRRALALQNRLVPENQRSVRIHLERLGTNREDLVGRVCAHLPENRAALFALNFSELDRDPPTVAVAAAFLAVYDRARWKILPASTGGELFVLLGAQLACAVSGRYDKYETYREILAGEGRRSAALSPLPVVCRAWALGFMDKWEE